MRYERLQPLAIFGGMLLQLQRAHSNNQSVGACPKPALPYMAGTDYPPANKLSFAGKSVAHLIIAQRHLTGTLNVF